MLTILIAARNAANTIERAIGSVLEEECPLLLIDDHSSDDTVARAMAIGGDRLRVIEAPDPGGIPVARQAGLDAIETDYAAWLDADDEWIPGRAARLLVALKSGVDIVSDPIDLHDGLTGRWLRRLDVPDLLRCKRHPVRLFERNYLPGDTQVGFRVEVFRDVGGYDFAVFGAESFDVLLRAVIRGATFSYCDEAGYRMYAYPGSVSRNLSLQRAALKVALRKHDYDKVKMLCLAEGYKACLVGWVLVSMALFREDPDAALRFIEEAAPVGADQDGILEPEGPCPLPEGWKRAFFRGTALLLRGENDDEAFAELCRAEQWGLTAEGANNLGVALWRMGRPDDAVAMFSAALKLFPGYYDAGFNRKASVPDHITTHPLRRYASRTDYAVR